MCKPDTHVSMQSTLGVVGDVESVDWWREKSFGRHLSLISFSFLIPLSFSLIAKPLRLRNSTPPR